jgi:hypothetical protein
VRSGIFAFILGMAYLFTHFSLRLKLFSLSVIVFMLAISIDTSLFGKYQPLVDSMIYFNDPAKSYGGSSLDMRLLQLDGAISLWEKGGIIFGNGFGWCGYYSAQYGDHPVLLGFESILFVMIIENGIMGIILYGFVYLSFFRINYLVYKKAKIIQKMEYWIITSYLISYIIFILVTGMFGFNLFLIFLVIMFLKILLKNKETSSYAIEK